MSALDLIMVLVSITVLGIVVRSLIVAQASFAPWIPSSTAMAARAFAFVQPTKNMKFADLGCGDGRILFFANKKYGMSGDGYEISIIPYYLARLRLLLHRTSTVRILRKNLYDAPINQYDLVYIYGLPRSISARLLQKLDSEMKPGSRLISYNFHLDNKKPIAQFHDRWRNVYVYQF